MMSLNTSSTSALVRISFSSYNTNEDGARPHSEWLVLLVSWSAMSYATRLSYHLTFCSRLVAAITDTLTQNSATPVEN